MPHNTKACTDLENYENKKAGKEDLELLLMVERVELRWLDKSG